MELEENYILERAGRENHFRVPEGYFEQLPQRVVSQLPERSSKSRLVSLRLWHYAAACVVAVFVMGVTFLFLKDSEAQKVQVAKTTINVMNDNSYIDEAADYAMIDNVEIYACLAEN